VFVCFVDIDGIVDYHCLNALFIILPTKKLFEKQLFFKANTKTIKISEKIINIFTINR